MLEGLQENHRVEEEHLESTRVRKADCSRRQSIYIVGEKALFRICQRNFLDSQSNPCMLSAALASDA